MEQRILHNDHFHTTIEALPSELGGLLGVEVRHIRQVEVGA
jgi:hypothetical protein